MIVLIRLALARFAVAVALDLFDVSYRFLIVLIPGMGAPGEQLDMNATTSRGRNVSNLPIKIFICAFRSHR